MAQYLNCRTYRLEGLYYLKVLKARLRTSLVQTRKAYRLRIYTYTMRSSGFGWRFLPTWYASIPHTGFVYALEGQRTDYVKGFAESYMLGEVSSPDLTKFFEVSSVT